MTTSELIVTATIWALTAVGGFFALRGIWRRRRHGAAVAAKNRNRLP
ncbi:MULTISPECIES: hypothetical protein [Geobacter]|uniref:Uncharacterized protein n=1 Tax=Geobacter sulfurreducens (strain ATCC 51573 / DSM 12127 / PCA) TaxID=243231 RepID=I7F9E0_GEOSL|nr:hypothetical protein [Geobacter sulfurreducens]BET60065.1 hypothetical protein GEO60473_31050 [Geobacter sp. 60473]AFP20384.1 hypothetical protein GSU3479 [Geobacter sulfurreducens PCA]AJY69958.1 hypothetical protein RW64_10355 [Geobacter sulfurreducens]UAC04321.1 hypothetical protein KVP06_01130 [Geobacter sulfurreducens]BEH08580.1 hypothetical protein GSUET_01920 [Geobacter sulfurreducens subsp. ethanolicus]